MSSHVDYKADSGDAENDLTSDGILSAVRDDTDYDLEPRAAFDEANRATSPSPPPQEGGARFFLDSESSTHGDDETASTFSPMPEIAISNADGDSIVQSVHESITSDGPSELQARGPHDPFSESSNVSFPSAKHVSDSSGFTGIFEGYESPSPPFSPPFSPSSTPPPRFIGGIASRPYLPHMNSIQFQSSQNPLLPGTPSTPGSPGSPLGVPLASPSPITGRLMHKGSTAFSRDALSSPPLRSLHHSISAPALRQSPHLAHSSSGFLRPGTPNQFGIPRKPVPKLRRQRSTALPDYDDEVTGDYAKGKKKKPRYYNPHDSTIPKPWLQNRDRKELWSRLLTFGCILMGAILGGVLCYSGASSVQLIGNVCLVLDEEFSGSTLSNSTWVHDVEMGGFGNGEFEMMTSSSNNSYIEDGILYIVPTLTSDNLGDSAIFNGYTFNLTGCTSSNVTACSAISNSTTKTIINPVQSARISTLVNGSTTSIKYGRVEVRARMPRGDWLWPAIWMLPVNNSYGNWPMSGEIDIVESRGNNRSYPKQGDNYVRGSLNWGPNNFINSVAKTFGWFMEKRINFNDDFHTYTLEWTEDFLRIYIDTRLHKMLYLDFKKESFWQRGNYPQNAWNGTQEVEIDNPWAGRGNSAPFDQSFYLILNVAVGGTNGWFPDGAGGKPWLDGSNTAMYDFAQAQSEWYPTWPTDPKQRGMAIDSVKMWQQC